MANLARLPKISSILRIPVWLLLLRIMFSALVNVPGKNHLQRIIQAEERMQEARLAHKNDQVRAAGLSAINALNSLIRFLYKRSDVKTEGRRAIALATAITKTSSILISAARYDCENAEIFTARMLDLTNGLKTQYACANSQNLPGVVEMLLHVWVLLSREVSSVLDTAEHVVPLVSGSITPAMRNSRRIVSLAQQISALRWIDDV